MKKVMEEIRMKAMRVILIALVLALVAPAAMAVIAPHYEIIYAEHRSGNCVYTNATRTHYECELVYQNVTDKVAAIANGNPVFRFDTHRRAGGLFTRYGLAWHMPSNWGNLQSATVRYRVDGGPVKQLVIRDQKTCWFNLAQNRVFCPAVTLVEGMSASMDDIFSM